MDVEIESSGKRYYRIVNREPEGEWPQMVLHPSECFEIVSERIPLSWRIKIYKNSFIKIAPESWLKLDFLESFYDHEPEAYEIYKKERDIIMQEDP